MLGFFKRALIFRMIDKIKVTGFLSSLPNTTSQSQCFVIKQRDKSAIAITKIKKKFLRL